MDKVQLQGVYVGMPAPDFTALTVAGEKVKLSDYQGKLVYLDFWATWCSPCIEAMPSIQKVASGTKDDRFVILLVSVDDKPGTVADFLKKRKKPLPGVVVHAERGMKGELAKLYNIESVPTNFLIGPDGKVLVNDVSSSNLRTTVRRELAKLKQPETRPVETAGK
ncbi:MAG: TlpA disulfide reductase family protein [Planctomycetota bacterium]